MNTLDNSVLGALTKNIYNCVTQTANTVVSNAVSYGKSVAVSSRDALADAVVSSCKYAVGINNLSDAFDNLKEYNFKNAGSDLGVATTKAVASMAFLHGSVYNYTDFITSSDPLLSLGNVTGAFNTGVVYSVKAAVNCSALIIEHAVIPLGKTFIIKAVNNPIQVSAAIVAASSLYSVANDVSNLSGSKSEVDAQGNMYTQQWTWLETIQGGVKIVAKTAIAASAIASIIY